MGSARLIDGKLMSLMGNRFHVSVIRKEVPVSKKRGVSCLLHKAAVSTDSMHSKIEKHE